MRLAGIVEIRADGWRMWRAARRELKRSGMVGLADVLAFRLFSQLVERSTDAAWTRDQVAALQRRYPADLNSIPRIVVRDPNGADARAFITAAAPDIIIARCKFLLKPEIFELATAGAFALHPGICPEYRNAHGCFWALANRDLERVGMTLLKIDRGVDTGPALLHATCNFDEVSESHYVIQQRVVIENLDRIGAVLKAAAAGTATPLNSAGRASAVWGQPRLSSYLRWKRAARRDRERLHDLPVVS